MIKAGLILGTLRQPVLVLDKALHPKLANPAFYHTFGLEQGDLEGEFIREFIAGENCGAPMGELLKSIIASEGGVEGVETLCAFQTPTGKLFPLMVNARRLPAKGPIEMIIVELRCNCIDKEPELRIHELNEKLRNRVIAVDEVNKELDSYTQSICEACMSRMFHVNEELESYSHSVAHDLRSPLRFVNKIAYMLLDESGAKLSVKAIAQVNMIVQATDEMERLIEHLFNFSQASRVPMEMRKVDLHKLFQKIAKQQKNREKGREVEIEIQEMKPCQGDQTLLKEVVTNLLENAFKYTRLSEGAKITVGCAEKGGECIYFVKDNGAGFDMNESGSLFLPFKRLHSEEVFKGTGVGLSLVKRIIERHDGRIWAEGEIGKGATFYFTLGKAVAESSAQKANSAAEIAHKDSCHCDPVTS